MQRFMGAPQKHLVDPNLATDLSFDLSPTVQWLRNPLVTFNITKSMLVTFHPQRAEFSSVMMNGRTHN